MNAFTEIKYIIINYNPNSLPDKQLFYKDFYLFKRRNEMEKNVLATAINDTGEVWSKFKAWIQRRLQLAGEVGRTFHVNKKNRHI